MLFQARKSFNIGKTSWEVEGKEGSEMGESKRRKLRVDMIKAYYILVWKCYHETCYFVQLLYTNEKADSKVENQATAVHHAMWLGWAGLDQAQPSVVHYS